MQLDALPLYVTLLIALSVATERAVEIFKGFIPWLDREDPNALNERVRKAILQALAVLAGVLISFLTWPVIAQLLGKPEQTARDGAMVAALGLLASGGSGFWNSMLGYVTSLKDLKKSQASITSDPGQPAGALPQPSAGTIVGP